MRLVLVHARAMTLELARHPAYLVPTVLFPSAFFLFFGTGATGAAAAEVMAAFAGFAAIGVAFFQFGVGIAVERVSPWEAYVRTLPVGVATRLAARVLSAAAFAAAAAACVLAVAVATTGAALSAARWLALGAVLAAGAAPFALLGVALGYWAPARGALPIANLLYLGLSYAGGLWIPPEHLPDGVAAVSPFLPTRALGDALTGAVRGDRLVPHAVLALAGWTAVFAALAAWGYRRDEGRRFR